MSNICIHTIFYSGINTTMCVKHRKDVANSETQSHDKMGIVPYIAEHFVLPQAVFEAERFL